MMCKGTILMLNSFLCLLLPLCVLLLQHKENVLLCGVSEFMCLNHTQCVYNKWRCDGIADCDDGSDEKQCLDKCESNQFSCDNGKCIESSWQCDNRNDCGDGSDERPKRCPSTCHKEDFSCDNDSCIHPQWVCDGHPDCKDSSDETPLACSSANHKTCEKGSLQCKADRKCVSKHLWCDGHPNCLDGSDEEDCSSLGEEGGLSCNGFLCKNNACIASDKVCDTVNDCPTGEDERSCLFTCKEGFYKCGSSNQCIKDALVCDQHRDCMEGDDESPSCFVNECAYRNGGCNQLCEDFRVGYACHCKSGFKLEADNHTCSDENECLTLGVCSQHCENTEGSFRCSCYPGYILQHDRFCKALGSHPVLVFTNEKSIRALDIRSKLVYMSVAENLEHATGVSFFAQHNYIYWSDLTEHKIYRSTLGKPVTQVVLIEDAGRSLGIAVDWMNLKLYWSDERKKAIFVSQLNGQKRYTLLGNIDPPKYIAVDNRDRIAAYRARCFCTNSKFDHSSVLTHRFIYWTSWYNVGKIQRISMDGDITTHTILFKRNNSWPKGFVIDFTIDRIFFVDSSSNTIESLCLNGKNHQVLLYNTNRFLPHSVTAFEELLYWTDWSSNSIYQMNKFTGDGIKVVQASLSKPLGITILHALLQPGASNPCWKAKCSYLCLFSHNHGYKCVCPTGFTLLNDNETCNTPSSFHCYDGFCEHGGTCYNTTAAAEQTLPQCYCPFGFSGSKCEIRLKLVTSIYRNGKIDYKCLDGYCFNAGMCIVEDSGSMALKNPLCNCTVDFYGNRCEHPRHLLTSKESLDGRNDEDDDDKRDFYTTLVISLVTTALILFFGGGCLFLYWKISFYSTTHENRIAFYTTFGGNGESLRPLGSTGVTNEREYIEMSSR